MSTRFTGQILQRHVPERRQRPGSFHIFGLFGWRRVAWLPAIRMASYAGGKYAVFPADARKDLQGNRVSLATWRYPTTQTALPLFRFQKRFDPWQVQLAARNFHWGPFGGYRFGGDLCPLFRWLPASTLKSPYACTRGVVF